MSKIASVYNGLSVGDIIGLLLIGVLSAVFGAMLVPVEVAFAQILAYGLVSLAVLFVGGAVLCACLLAYRDRHYL